MRVFFYGLFMDESVLAAKDIAFTAIATGYVEDFQLRIGERATLLHKPGGRAWGNVMDVSSGDAARLYSEKSVADYVPETVVVETGDGTQLEATCYNLPREAVAGTNRSYAKSLLALAIRCGFPESYLDEIRRVAE